MEPGTHWQRTWLQRQAWKRNGPSRLGTCVLVKLIGAIWLLTRMKTGRLTASITCTGKFQHLDCWILPVLLCRKGYELCNPFMLLFFSSRIYSIDKMLKKLFLKPSQTLWLHHDNDILCKPFPNNAFIVLLPHLSYKINNLALLLSYIFSFKSLLPGFGHKQGRNWFILLWLDEEK